MRTRKTNIDKVLTPEYKISDDAKIYLDNIAKNITPEMQQKAVEYVNNTKFYKGTKVSGLTTLSNLDDGKPRVVSGAIFTSDNKLVGESYTTKEGDTYTMNLTINNPFIFDANNKVFSQIGNNITSDNIAAYALQNGYDSAVIYNVVDVGTYSLDIKDKKALLKPSTDVVVFSDDNISNLSSKKEVSLDKPLKEKRNI